MHSNQDKNKEKTSLKSHSCQRKETILERMENLKSPNIHKAETGVGYCLRERRHLFWAGLLVLSLASVVLFSAFWGIRYYAVLSQGLEINLPPIVGGIVFVLIGLYMMKSGVKREAPSTRSSFGAYRRQF
jgi:hypothetical protein